VRERTGHRSHPHLGEVVSFGCLAVTESGESIAAIRGTDTIWEWLHDASRIEFAARI
jgi:hypothetical protein